jgi:hypothetical protein
MGWAMGLHWEPQNDRIRTEADDMLRDFGGTDVARRPGRLGRTCARDGGGADMTAAVVDEILYRSAADVLYWPGPGPIEEDVLIWGPHGPVTIRSVETPPLEDDAIPW